MIITPRVLLSGVLALPLHAVATTPDTVPPPTPQYRGLPPELQALAGTRVVSWIVGLSARTQGPLVGRMEAQVMEDAAGARFVQQRSGMLCEATADVCARLRANRQEMADLVNSDD